MLGASQGESECWESQGESECWERVRGGVSVERESRGGRERGRERERE